MVQRFVVERLIRDDELTITPADALFSSGLLSSFAVTQLIVFLEDSFSIRIPITEVTLDDFDTIERIVRVVTRFRR